MTKVRDSILDNALEFTRLVNTCSETTYVLLLYYESFSTLFGSGSLEGVDSRRTAASGVSRVSSSTAAMPVVHM